MVRWRQLLRQLVAVTAVFGYATSDESQERENDERQRHYVTPASMAAEPCSEPWLVEPWLTERWLTTPQISVVAAVRQPPQDDKVLEVLRALYDFKGLARPAQFNGEPATWPEFKEDFVNLMTAVDLDELCETLLRAKSDEVEQAELEYMLPSKIVYSVLRSLLGPIPRTIIRTVPRGNGFTAWVTLAREYEPRGSAGRLADLTKILNPNWDQAEFMADWAAWERNVAEFELKYGATIPSDIRCAVVAQNVPYRVKLNLRAVPVEMLENYPKLKETVMDMFDRGNAFGLDWKNFWRGSGPAPTELDLVKPWRTRPPSRRPLPGTTFGNLGRREPQYTPQQFSTPSYKGWRKRGRPRQGEGCEQEQGPWQRKGQGKGQRKRLW